MADEDWRVLAECANWEPELWFPDHDPGALAEARRVCAGCPVSLDCLEYALGNPKEEGVWAGTTVSQRDRIRRARRRASA